MVFLMLERWGRDLVNKYKSNITACFMFTQKEGKFIGSYLQLWLALQHVMRMNHYNLINYTNPLLSYIINIFIF